MKVVLFALAFFFSANAQTQEIDYSKLSKQELIDLTLCIVEVQHSIIYSHPKLTEVFNKLGEHLKNSPKLTTTEDILKAAQDERTKKLLEFNKKVTALAEIACK